MKEYSVFDVLGPIMIGPSSSHTAGAARLAKIAMEIAGDGFTKVKFLLHGSFAKTYRGHGTDKALVAGVLGFSPSDEKLRESFDIAKIRNIDIEFVEADLGYQHPNTVKIIFKYPDKDDFYVLGSSIGGGNIVIYDINGDLVEFTGAYPTLIIKYIDQKGMVNRITSILWEKDINIANMKVVREGNIATMLCETDTPLNEVKELSNIDGILDIRTINTKRS